MPGRVRYTDGIRIDLTSGETVVVDADAPDGAINVVSHAHGDHLYSQSPAQIVCSALTHRLAAERRAGESLPARTSHPAIELREAGHVPGSRAVRIVDDERTYLYTGDISTRERFLFDGFEPVTADVLVIESTYGKPGYEFPPQEELEREIVGWLEETRDRPVILFGYSLGRAQELQLLATRAGRHRLLVSSAIARINSVIEDALNVDFGAQEYASSDALEPGDVLVLPSQTAQLAFVDRLCAESDAIKAGFSGWAVDEGFRYRGDFDTTFVLSDHCDFSELIAVVEAVDPERVYTQHGFADEFASHLTTLGYDARALRENQTSLDEF